jgi:sugar lactone lactonase YvrE
MRAWLAAVLGFALVTVAFAEPAVVASGSYPEGLLWHNGRLMFTEMGADRVTLIESAGTRTFWHDSGCGPTSIAPFGTDGYLVNCHLSHEVVEVTAAGTTGRRFQTDGAGRRIEYPNASAPDGRGGVFFSDSGIFHLQAPATGRVYHIDWSGAMTEVAGEFHYANGVAFDPQTRTLYVSEHLARRVLALTLDSRNRVAGARVFADFAQIAATRAFTYPQAGPDGIALKAGLLVVAEYGEGRLHIFERSGRHLNTLKVAMPFVDTVHFDGSDNLYAGGAFRNDQPPFEGRVVRFAPTDWERRSRGAD